MHVGYVPLGKLRNQLGGLATINKLVDGQALRRTSKDEAASTDEFLKIHTGLWLQHFLVLLAVFDQKTGLFPCLPRAGDTSG